MKLSDGDEGDVHTKNPLRSGWPAKTMHACVSKLGPMPVALAAMVAAVVAAAVLASSS